MMTMHSIEMKHSITPTNDMKFLNKRSEVLKKCVIPDLSDLSDSNRPMETFKIEKLNSVCLIASLGSTTSGN